MARKSMLRTRAETRSTLRGEAGRLCLSRFTASQAGAVGKLAVYIGPELFQKICGYVHPKLNAKLGDSVACRPVIGIVRSRDRHSSRIADDLRKIEPCMIRIRVRPEDLAGSASHA